MVKTLEKLAKSVKNTARGIGRTAALSTLGLASYLSANNAYADKFVNNTMDVTTINNTIASATSGEDVHFAAGTYQINFGEPAYLITSGARLVADGIVTLRGPDPLSGVVVRLNSINSGISGFIVENSAKGISSNADFDPSVPIYITGNTIQNVDTGISWTNKDVVGDNSLPSVIVDGNYINNSTIGQIFDGASGGTTNPQTTWLKATNNTYENLNGVILEPVFYISGGQNGVAAGILITLGVNDFDGNITINSNAVTFPDEAYTAARGPITGTTTAAVDIPDANGEMDTANCRDTNNCTYQFVGYLSNAFGGNNVASESIDDAVISWSKRPVFRNPGQGPSSPFVGDGKCKKIDGTERHYCGAFPPMGDVNADGKLDDIDQSTMVYKINNPGSVTLTDKQVFDFDGDGDIDMQDLAEFTRGYSGQNPTIPTLGEVGAGAMALLLLGAGAKIISKRRNLTSRTSN